MKSTNHQNEIVIMATIIAKPGCGNKMLELLLTLIRDSKAEKGCLTYDLHIDPDNPETLFIYEIWQDENALELHTGSPHFKKYRQESLSILNLLDVQKLKKYPVL